MPGLHAPALHQKNVRGSKDQTTADPLLTQFFPAASFPLLNAYGLLPLSDPVPYLTHFVPASPRQVLHSF